MANLPNDPTKHNGHYAHHYATKYNNGNLYGILPTTTDAYHGNGLPPRGSCEDPRFVARRKRPSKLTWFRQVNLTHKIFLLNLFFGPWDQISRSNMGCLCKDRGRILVSLPDEKDQAKPLGLGRDFLIDGFFFETF